MQVGITGGIGAGKSYICRIFKVLGAPIYNADIQAKMLMREDPKIIKEIISVFGKDAYLQNGMLNRPFLARQIFSDKRKLETMNSIVHPRVADHYNDWVRIELQIHPYVVKEAALMFTNGNYKKLDKVIVVDAPIEKRVQRVLERDHRPKNQIEDIINKQQGEEKLFNLADIKLQNDDSSLLIPEIINLHRSFSNYEILVK
ncbi:dephospho-CoA kinase [Flammeovirga pectinis]|uniref:Dephospho-CoA kinase n=1 Tax=Flammeovirga pectinis TaxID=2494373 RepID=A0A3S9P7M0_9BACT|nr:dephospho-CoA kinase [Flammeovirga pectinis]AZQ64198.1 dephospho-CoA kinase [Flammeovirga pectinis]